MINAFFVQVLDTMSEFQNGRWVTGILAPYLDLLGGWFWAVMTFALAISIYVKTGSMAAVAVILLISSGSLFALLPPESHTVAYIMLALTITSILYTLFKSR